MVSIVDLGMLKFTCKYRCEVNLHECTFVVPFTGVCKTVGATMGILLLSLRVTQWVFEISLSRDKGYD